jgi:hypothetical protein
MSRGGSSAAASPVKPTIPAWHPHASASAFRSIQSITCASAQILGSASLASPTSEVKSNLLFYKKYETSGLIK